MRWPPLHNLKLVNSRHMVYTHVQTIEEAVDLLMYQKVVKERRQRKLEHPRPLTLRQQFGNNKLRQRSVRITLSDRVIPSETDKRRPVAVVPRPKPATMTAKKERARELYATGYWKPLEISHEVGAELDKVKKWLKGMRITR